MIYYILYLQSEFILFYINIFQIKLNTKI